VLLLERREGLCGFAKLLGFGKEVVDRIDVVDGLGADVVELLKAGSYLTPNLFQPIATFPTPLTTSWRGSRARFGPG
jgi:hypothetical protein